MKKDPYYHVALRYTKHAGPDYRGLITKHRFEDKEHFEGWLRRRDDEDYEVVAHGISENDVIKLCQDSEKEMAERTGKTVRNARRATDRAKILLADPRIRAILRSSSHQCH